MLPADNIYHIETHCPTCALSGLNQRPAHANVFVYGVPTMPYASVIASVASVRDSEPRVSTFGVAVPSMTH